MRNLHRWQKFYTAAGSDGMDKFHLCLLWQSPAHVSCNKFSIVLFVELLFKSDGWSWLPPWVILIELFGKDLLSTWHCNPDWAANSKEQRSQSIRLFVRGYIVAQDRVSRSHNEYSWYSLLYLWLGCPLHIFTTDKGNYLQSISQHFLSKDIKS